METMGRILQQENPKNYIIVTNETHTVREFVELAFKEIGVNIEWKGEGIEEKGIDRETGRVLVDINPVYFRPSEVELLWGRLLKSRKRIRVE